MRISDWSSDVCSSDLRSHAAWPSCSTAWCSTSRATPWGASASPPCAKSCAPTTASTKRRRSTDHPAGRRHGAGLDPPCNPVATALAGAASAARLFDRESGREGNRGYARVGIGGRLLLKKKRPQNVKNQHV